VDEMAVEAQLEVEEVETELNDESARMISPNANHHPDL
jgi:hypothetical protein